MSIYSAPSLSGTMSVSASYNVMSTGLTNRVFIIGHADGLNLNDPYQVLDVADACIALNLDSTSPLVRTLLEVYYGGGRDIWLVAAAPMSEYVADPSQRDETYYQTYADRLVDTYAVLEYWDLAQIIVLAEAPFYDAHGVDFVTPLADHCQAAFETTGQMRIALVGTRVGIALTSVDVNNMVNDPRIGTWDNPGKFVSVMVGEGIYSFAEMPVGYSASVIGTVAAILASLDLRISLIYTPLPNMISSLGSIIQSDMVALSNAQLNPVSQTTKGVRGQPFQVVVMTDNTLAPSGSDYWSLGETRLVLQLFSQLTTLGKRYMGTIGYTQFQQDCNTFMDAIVANNYIRSYTLNITRDPNSSTAIFVDITLVPYTSLRQISFTTTIGPGA